MNFFRETHFDFEGKRRYAYIFSGTLILIGIISLIIHGGPRYSVDFLGGLSMRVRFAKQVSEGEVRNALDAVKISGSEVKTIREFGKEPEILIKVALEKTGTETQEIVTNALKNYFSDNPIEVRSVERVGPKIGAELRNAAILASLFTLILISLYLSWRFEFKFGVGAILSLFHDLMITVGFFSVFNKEVSLAVVAALLTILGFSINDTIVVFDRIRENLRKVSNKPLEEIINLSINETLSRTVITTGTVYMIVVVLFIFGGHVIHDFMFALLVGFFFGTYSSIYIAAPVLLEWKSREILKKKPVR
jgi:preprotein translocase SecF subunit